MRFGKAVEAERGEGARRIMGSIGCGSRQLLTSEDPLRVKGARHDAGTGILTCTWSHHAQQRLVMLGVAHEADAVDLC